jgi:phosphoglycerate kinase
MSHLLTLEDLPPLKGKCVLVRVDFNVPLADGQVKDATRLEESLPTLRELLAAGGRLLLVSHCGRPKNGPDPRFSLRPVASKLAELLGRPVGFAEDCVGPVAERAAAALSDGDLCVLENLRFHAGEEKNEPAFVEQLARLATVYVGDAFGSAHRAHASVVGVAERIGVRAAGRLLAREVKALTHLLGDVKRPFVGILGGAKIEGKIETLENLLPRLDVLLLGGGMANTFLAAQGFDLKSSLVERERVELAKSIMAAAVARGTKVVLPQDVVVADSFEAPTEIRTVAVDAIPDKFMALDVGSLTRQAFIAECGVAGTLFWNGPLGVFEKPPFHEGTQQVAAGLALCAGFTVVGGGETVAAVNQAGVADQISHVSTGGGASLELLAGRILPGVAVLETTA